MPFSLNAELKLAGLCWHLECVRYPTLDILNGGLIVLRTEESDQLQFPSLSAGNFNNSLCKQSESDPTSSPSLHPTRGSLDHVQTNKPPSTLPLQSVDIACGDNCFLTEVPQGISINLAASLFFSFGQTLLYRNSYHIYMCVQHGFEQ